MTAAPATLDARKGYARWAASYDSCVNPIVALEERSLRALLPDAKGKRVVDLGCGTGRTLKLWREQRPAELIGIDFSLPMLQRAKPWCGTLITADCCALPLRDEVADFVSCCLTVGYLSDLPAFAKELARVLKPGAAAYISELHPDTATRFGWKRAFADGARAITIASRSIPISEILSIFGEAGLEPDILLEPAFGAPERVLFEAAGKADSFERFSGWPAIYLLRLHRGKTASAVSNMSFTVTNARLALSGNDSAHANLAIVNGNIHSLGEMEPIRERVKVDLTDYLLLPGLINAHDHLEFALFPRLGSGPYQNGRQWAEDIYHPEQSPIREHLRVPKWVRLWWGGIRNLLAGVTTVCHHNPYDETVFEGNFPVRVLRDFAWAHSVHFDSEIADKRAAMAAEVPFIIHAAEGIDRSSAEEIELLSENGWLDERTVIVHGNALNDDELRQLDECGASLVWCPTSNHFLFGHTLTAPQIQNLSRKALGSDSPLTAAGDLLDELRFAVHLGFSTRNVYELVTTHARHVLRLRRGEGRLYPGAAADFVAVRDQHETPAETLARSSYDQVELVVVGGSVKLASEEMMSRLPTHMTQQLELLVIDGLHRWIAAPIRDLLRLSREALGPKITMSGRVLTQ